MTSSAKITIRKSRPSDALESTKLFYETWLDTYPNKKAGIKVSDVKDHFKNSLTLEGVEKQKAKIRSCPDNFKRLVAVCENKIVGACNIVIDKKYNELKAIYILPEYQRLGIGRRFWQRAMKFFDPNKNIIVELADYNIKALSFYKSLGFVDTGERFKQEIHQLKSGAIIPEMRMIIKRKKNIKKTPVR